MPGKPETVTVALTDLIEALSIRTAMRRAPRGVRSQGLNDAAVYPSDGGVEFAMPGLSKIIPILSGQLTRPVAFQIKTLPNVIKLLKTYVGKEDVAAIEVTRETISFRCAGSKVSLRCFPAD